MKQADIKCKKCGNEEFKLRLAEVDRIMSIIADCKCGRVVEYRNFKEAIMVSIN